MFIHIGASIATKLFMVRGARSGCHLQQVPSVFAFRQIYVQILGSQIVMWVRSRPLSFKVLNFLIVGNISLSYQENIANLVTASEHFKYVLIFEDKVWTNVKCLEFQQIITFTVETSYRKLQADFIDDLDGSDTFNFHLGGHITKNKFCIGITSGELHPLSPMDDAFATAMSMPTKAL